MSDNDDTQFSMGVVYSYSWYAGDFKYVFKYQCTNKTVSENKNKIHMLIFN